MTQAPLCLRFLSKTINSGSTLTFAFHQDSGWSPFLQSNTCASMPHGLSLCSVHPSSDTWCYPSDKSALSKPLLDAGCLSSS